MEGSHDDHRIFQSLGLVNIEKGHLSFGSIGFFIFIFPHPVFIPEPQVAGEESIYILQRFLAVTMIFFNEAVKAADEPGHGGEISGFIAFSLSRLVDKAGKGRERQDFVGHGKQIFRKLLFSFYFPLHRTKPPAKFLVFLHHGFRHGQEKSIGAPDSLGFIHHPVLPQFAPDGGEHIKQASQEPGHFLSFKKVARPRCIYGNMPFIQGILEANGGIALHRIKEQCHLVIVRYAAPRFQFFNEIAHPVFKKGVIFLRRNPHHRRSSRLSADRFHQALSIAVETAHAFPGKPVGLGHPVHAEGNDALIGAVIGVKSNHMAAAAELLWKLQDIGHRGAAEPVNALVIVTYYEDVPLPAA